MDHPLIEIFLCLLVAALIGAAVGWLLHHLTANKNWGEKVADITKEHEETEALLYNFKKQNKALNSQLLHLTSQVKTKESANVTLAKSLTKIRTARIEAEDQFKNITNEFEKLQDKNTGLDHKYHSLSEELRVLLSSHDEMKETETGLQSELVAAKDENINLQSKFMDSTIQVEELEQIKLDLNSSLDEQKGLAEDSKLQVEEISAKLSTAEATLNINEKTTGQSLKAAKKKQDEFKEKLKTAQDAQAKLEKELVLTKEVADHYDAEKIQNTELAAKNDEFKESLKTAQSAQEKLEKELVLTKEVADHYDAEKIRNTELAAKNDEFKENLKIAQSAQEKLEKELVLTKEVADHYDAEKIRNTELAAKNIDLLSEVDSLKKQVSNVSDELTKNEIQRVDFNLLNKQYNSLLDKQDKQDKQDKLKGASVDTDEVKQLRKENEALLAQYDTAIKDKDSLKEQLYTSLNANDKLTDNETKYNQSQKEISQLQSKLKTVKPTATTDSESNKEQIESLEKVKADQEELSKLRAQVASLDEENQQLNQENNNIETKVTSLSSSDDLQDELARYRNYLHASEKRWTVNYQTLENTFNEYKLSKNKELESSKAQYKKTINDLSDSLNKQYSNNTQKRPVECLICGEDKIIKVEESKPSSNAGDKVIKDEESKPSSNAEEDKVIKDEVSKPSSNAGDKIIKDEESKPSNNAEEDKVIKDEESRPSSNVEDKTIKDEESKSSSNTEVTSCFEGKNLKRPEITVHINKFKKGLDEELENIQNIPVIAEPSSDHKNDDGRMPIEEIEGISTTYKKRFQAINIYYVDSLLNKGKTVDSRNELAEQTDINNDLITGWVQNADLLRLDDMTPRYAKLLGFADIHNIQSIAKQDKLQLETKLKEAYKEKSFCPELPSNERIEMWIKQAKQLEVKIS